MKERLIKLLNDVGDNVINIPTDNFIESLADYLLANGVIVPPCKVGDTVYVIETCTCYSQSYANACKRHFDDDKRIKALLIVPREIKGYRKHKSCFKLFERKFQLKHLNQIGKTVFLSREEAEKALAERSEGK